MKTLLGIALIVLGSYYFLNYAASLDWNPVPPESPSLEHEGNDYSSLPYPSCLPFGNSNYVSQPDVPHRFCFDGADSPIRGQFLRFQ